MWTCGIIACMYIVHQLQHSCYFNDTFIIVLKQLPHATIMQFFKKSNIVDYIYMYDVYKLLYKRSIFNSLATIIQLIDFSDVAISLLLHRISKRIVTKQLYYPKDSYITIVHELFFEFQLQGSVASMDVIYHNENYFQYHLNIHILSQFSTIVEKGSEKGL